MIFIPQAIETLLKIHTVMSWWCCWSEIVCFASRVELDCCFTRFHST